MVDCMVASEGWSAGYLIKQLHRPIDYLVFLVCQYTAIAAITSISPHRCTAVTCQSNSHLLHPIVFVGKPIKSSLVLYRLEEMVGLYQS